MLAYHGTWVGLPGNAPTVPERLLDTKLFVCNAECFVFVGSDTRLMARNVWDLLFIKARDFRKPRQTTPISVPGSVAGIRTPAGSSYQPRPDSRTAMPPCRVVLRPAWCNGRPRKRAGKAEEASSESRPSFPTSRSQLRAVFSSYGVDVLQAPASCPSCSNLIGPTRIRQKVSSTQKDVCLAS